MHEWRGLRGEVRGKKTLGVALNNPTSAARNIRSLLAWAANPERALSDSEEESAQRGAELLGQALNTINRFDQASLKPERM